MNETEKCIIERRGYEYMYERYCMDKPSFNRYAILSMVVFIIVLHLAYTTLTIAILYVLWKEKRNSKMQPEEPAEQRMLVKFIDKETGAEATEFSVRYSPTESTARTALSTVPSMVPNFDIEDSPKSGMPSEKTARSAQQ